MIRNSKLEVKKRIEEKTDGRFEYIDGYKNKDSKVRVKCSVCGNESEYTYHHLTTAKSKCRYCSNVTQKRKEIEKDRHRIVKKWNRVKGNQLSFVPCLECGRLFIPRHGNTKICSAACKHKRINRWKDNRLNKSNIIDRDITLLKLYQRDKGNCYLCGIECDWNDKIIDNNGNVIVGGTYPTIDHVKALAIGGLHEWGNVKLACKSCNENKRTSPPVAL